MRQLKLSAEWVWKFYSERILKSQLLVRAGSLAFSTILSIVPIFGLVFWYLDSIQLTKHWLASVKEFLLQQLNFSAKADFLTLFDSLTTNVKSQSWGYIGVVMLLYTALALLTQFGDALDAVLRTHRNYPEPRGSVYLLYLRRALVMFWLPFALALSTAGVNWLRRDSWLRYFLEIKGIGPYMATILAWSTGLAAYFFMFRYMPANRVPAKQALKAAGIVAVGVELSRALFSVYTIHAASTQKIYGVFAILPLFFLWVQIGWILMLGAALSIRFPDKPEEERKPARKPRPA